jgi:pimeloyl-ACP methyl ester carboxylesterase
VKYQRYFDFYKKLGLHEEFTILTIKDNLILCGSIIKPILINHNNNKAVIFCHGVTNNRWSLFYIMHLVLQRGYQVVTYDARNHGASSKISTNLGQIEACDLQDVITYVKEKFNPEKIGLYGFSMGAVTCLFWLSYFAGPINSEIKFVICEAPFDYFAKQKRKVLGTGINRYWKSVLLDKIVKEFLNSSWDKLEKVNPFLVLPQQLPVKLLLLHGLEDSVLNWQASSNIYYQLTKDKLNKGKINLYFCNNADHGDLPFIADFVPNSLR